MANNIKEIFEIINFIKFVNMSLKNVTIKIVRKWYACSSIFRVRGSSIRKLDDWLASNLTSACNEIIGGSRNCVLLFCSFPVNWYIRIIVIRRYRRVVIATKIFHNSCFEIDSSEKFKQWFICVDHTNGRKNVFISIKFTMSKKTISKIKVIFCLFLFNK